MRVDDLRERTTTVPIALPGTETREPITDAAGTVRGSYVRTTRPLEGYVLVGAVPVPGPYGALRLRVDVVNDATAGPDEPREEVLRSSLISAHTVLGLDAGAFLSSADPPEWARPAVAACVNEHSWPVLAGPEGCARLVLASPIILDDHPQLAPESPTDLFDGTENDEILSLRTLALTDDEKREARATDPRAAGILDALDAMGPAMFERLHGTVRPGGRAPEADAVPTLVTPGTPWWDPAADASVDPDTDTALVDGEPVSRGQRGDPHAGGGQRRAGHVPARRRGHRAGRPARRRRADPRRGLDRRRPGRRPAGPPRPVPILPARRARGRDTPGECTVRVLVAGVGNVFLSDDGFGSEVARRLLATGGLPGEVDVVDVGIRGMHLAYQVLDGYRVLVVVDTTRGDGPPGSLYLLEHDLAAMTGDAAFDPHGMEPDAVLELIGALARGIGSHGARTGARPRVRAGAPGRGDGPDPGRGHRRRRGRGRGAPPRRAAA